MHNKILTLFDQAAQSEKLIQCVNATVGVTT